MFHSAFQQAARISQRRLQSTGTNTFIAKKKEAFAKGNFKTNWLSDPSTMPLILIMGVAGCLVLGVGTSCIFYNPDVQINPNKRGSTIRTWQF